jgi:hypothetical protein
VDRGRQRSATAPQAVYDGFNAVAPFLFCLVKQTARTRLEETLHELEKGHGIAANRVTSAMETYADALLDAVVSDLRRQLTRMLES